MALPEANWAVERLQELPLQHRDRCGDTRVLCDATRVCYVMRPACAMRCPVLTPPMLLCRCAYAAISLRLRSAMPGADAAYATARDVLKFVQRYAGTKCSTLSLRARRCPVLTYAYDGTRGQASQPSYGSR
eukprot:219686-Rhodomonas_salina.4